MIVVFTARADAGFVPIPQPDATYLGQTTLLPVSGLDFDTVSSLSSGGLTVSFDAPLVALTTPTTWSSWGSPPDVESSTPRVLWTNGVTSLTITLSDPVGLFGFEAQPNTQVVSSMLASFFLGTTLIGEIPLDVDGSGGAKLFAASSTTPFDTVVLSSTDDFAIAQIRVAVCPRAGISRELDRTGSCWHPNALDSIPENATQTHEIGERPGCLFDTSATDFGMLRACASQRTDGFAKSSVRSGSHAIGLSFDARRSSWVSRHGCWRYCLVSGQRLRLSLKDGRARVSRRVGSGQDGHDYVGPNERLAPSDIQDIHIAIVGLDPRREVVFLEVRSTNGNFWRFAEKPAGWRAEFKRDKGSAYRRRLLRAGRRRDRAAVSCSRSL